MYIINVRASIFLCTIVPDAPSFSVIPLYDQLTGRLLIIQTNSSTVVRMLILESIKDLNA